MSPDDKRMTASPLVTSLLSTYPFAFCLAGDNTIAALGQFFERKHPDLLAQPLTDRFALAYPIGEADLEDIISSARRHEKELRRIELSFRLSPAGTSSTGGDAEVGGTASRPDAFRLLGAFLPGDLPGSCLFLGTLAPGEIKDIAAYGIAIGDFGPIDPTPEFAMMAEVNASMLVDSQMMNEQLWQSRDEAVAARRALEEHREQLEALVKERTATIERQAAKLEQSLEQEKRLSHLQRSFVSMTSHEFRTPLAIIDGNAQRLQKTLDKMSTDDIAARVQKIRFAVKRMSALMESMLAAAQMEAGKIKIETRATDVRDLLAECCAMQQELTASHRIDLEMQAVPAPIVTDPSCLTQILTNLLSNAVKYSPDADRIHVRLERDEHGIAISVQDYGLGIEDDEQEKMFTRFFRARSSIGIPGTGIGLNLSQMLASELGGSIELRSQKAKGSTFTLRLPCDAAAFLPEAKSA